MILLGGVSAWGQTDYSGTYYIASGGNNGTYDNIVYDADAPTTNFYLCPTDKWYYYQSTSPYYLQHTDTPSSNDNGMPFMTTYQCRNGSYTANKAIWAIEKKSEENYYYIKHVRSGKYLTYNDAYFSNTGRVRVHLEDYSSEKDDYALFAVEYISSTNTYDIKSKYAEDNNKYPDNNVARKYLNVNKGNKQSLVGTSADKTTPAYSGGIIGFWTAGSVSDQNSRWVLEDVIPAPVISQQNHNTITISHSESGTATFYYTTDGTNPTTTNYTGTGSEITNITSSVTIKAIAVISQEDCSLPIISPVAEIRVVPNPTISLESSSIVYNGSEQTPAFSVMDGNTEIPVSEYTVSYSNNNINAGETVTVTITDNAGGNYIVYGSTTFTIAPKPLTITAKNKTITYGDAPANDGVTYSEFAGTETSAVLTGTLAYVYNYEQYGDAGSYTITPSGLSNSNYDITFATGTLTVNKKEVTVTSGITASDKTYDGTTDATLDGSTAVIAGKIGNDELTVLAGSGTFADKNVGTNKTVTINSFTFGGAKAGNYQMAASGHQATAQASITPATLTVNAEAKSKTYGDADPEFTYTSDGLISPDAISGLLSRAAGENVGTYAITQGTLTAGGNYSITYTGANLTISPKSLGDGNQPAEDIDIELTAEGNLNAVKDGSTTLEEDVDYTYTTETEGSDQFVTVTGIGNYTGSAKALYAKPVFTKPTGSNNAAAVYKASKDLANPSGITPYIVRKVNPSIGTITITPLQYIPEGVPVLLLSDEEAAGFVASPKEEATPEITDGTRNSNKLLVSQGGETVEAAQIYMFYLGEFVLTKAGTLSANKFYLYNPNYSATSTPTAQSQSVLQFVIEEEPTGINDVRSKTADVRSDYYTLDGRKLSGKPTKSGIYILKGQKMYIKN